MKTSSKPTGTFIHRFAIRLFTLLFAILWFWALGFFVNDIRALRGPDLKKIEEAHIARSLTDRQKTLNKQISNITRRIENHQEKQRVVGDSSRNLQQTLNQLLELQKLGLEQKVVFSEVEQANFANSLKLFLDNQTKYQTWSQTISDLLEEKQGMVRDKEETEGQIEKQRRPAWQEYERLTKKHRLKLACLQLAVLLPILVGAAVLLVKKRGSLYFPLYLALGAATLLKVGLVVHEYFPRRHFKYVLIGGLLIVVGRLLIYFIRAIAFPKAAWLVRQYREAYELFLCPVCEYPIRTGPRRFLFWTRRTVRKVVVPLAAGDQEEKYTCPSCGSALFEECASCHQVRHALLPACQYCGAEKEIH